MFDWTKVAGMPVSWLNDLARAMALSEKSTPVTIAPRLAQERESRPKWHCRCKSDLPATSPSSSSSIGRSVDFPALKLATSYHSDLACNSAQRFQSFLFDPI